MYYKYALAVVAFFTAALQISMASAQSAQLNNQKPKQVQNVGIDEHLGDKIPLDLKFAASSGDSVTLESLFEEDKPVLLNPVYYNCPMLCSMVINAVYQGVNDVKWNPGEDFDIITFSINPDEDFRVAASVKDSILQKFDRKGASDGWHFLTGKQEAIAELTDAVGFNYERLEKKGQFAHSAAVMFLSPNGTITRYLYGINYKEFDIRNGLYEAADGEIGSTIEKVVLYCFVYDADANSYVAVAWRIMQISGFVTMAALGIFLGFMWFGHKFRKNKKQTTNGSA
jgi:protein SCO1/2